MENNSIIDTSIFYLQSLKTIIPHLQNYEQMFILYKLKEITSKIDEFVLIHQDKLKETFNMNHICNDTTNDEIVDKFLPYMLLYQIFTTT